ncbi:MAG: tetratricopeptide repeat protein [Treponema sp.]|jgi:tetratricopeptide (TPR) repeat protein|nr:tetratricopeptide repeat protein [Treponema sp.]
MSDETKQKSPIQGLGLFHKKGASGDVGFEETGVPIGVEGRDEQILGEISELSKRGYQSLKEDRILEAIECFNKILGMDDNNNYALVGMGDAARKRGTFKEAITFYQRCLIQHPGNNYALFGLADCYKALSQYHKAIEIWEQYLHHDDKNITVLTRVADAYRKVRDFKHSKAVYLRVLEMEALNPYAIIGLGHLHYDFKEYRDALFYWEKMLEVGKENVDIRVLTSIGNCHRKLKTFDHGITFFKKALYKDPYNFYALFGLADCYRGMNQQSRSLEYWNRILEQDPRNKVILTRAGDAYRNLEDYDQAVNYYQRALNIEFDTYAVLGLAMVARSQGKYDEAIESLQRLIQQDTRNYRFYLELADCFLRKGEKGKALEILEAFQRMGIRNTAVMEFCEKLKS